MAPREDFNKALENHSKWQHRLDNLLNEGSTLGKVEGGWCLSSCEFGLWLQSQRFNSFQGEPDYQSLIKLHEAYHEAIETVIRLYEDHSHEQAIEYYEGDFKETSLRLTAEMLKYIARINQQELERYETL